MKRRGKQDNSSLDLFLDTICNTFGGIVFLAILLSVLLQMRSKNPESVQTEDVPVTPQEYQQIALELDELVSKRQRLHVAVAQLQLLQGDSQDNRVMELQEQLKRQTDALAESVRKQTESTKALTAQLQENAQIAQDLEQLSEELIEAEAALEQEEAALDEALAENMEVLKLPTSQISLKLSVIMLVREGKIYPVYEVASDTPFDRHVTTKKAGEMLEVTPIRQSGWDLADPAQRDEAIAYIRAHAPSRYFLSAGVFPDSFVEFNELKKIAIELGMEYHIVPFRAGVDVVISSASELPLVQ